MLIRFKELLNHYNVSSPSQKLANKILAAES